MIRRLVVVVFLLVAVGGACHVDDGIGSMSRTGETLLEPFEPAALEWEECGGKECATLVVPMDHASPNGPTIEVALARIRAAVEPRIGMLVLNPGGPGGSGIEMLNGWVTGWPIRRSLDDSTSWALTLGVLGGARWSGA